MIHILMNITYLDCKVLQWSEVIILLIQRKMETKLTVCNLAYFTSMALFDKFSATKAQTFSDMTKVGTTSVAMSALLSTF